MNGMGYHTLINYKEKVKEKIEENIHVKIEDNIREKNRGHHT